jgi:hypothetical protein
MWDYIEGLAQIRISESTMYSNVESNIPFVISFFLFFYDATANIEP